MSELILMDDAISNWLTPISVMLQIPALDPEVSLCRGTDSAWKTDAGAREAGAAIVRGAARSFDG
jgi:hypothetical protein